MTFFKIKLVKNLTFREAWIPFRACDEAQARIQATLRCTKTEFIPDYTSLQIINEDEYQLLSGIEFIK